MVSWCLKAEEEQRGAHRVIITFSEVCHVRNYFVPDGPHSKMNSIILCAGLIAQIQAPTGWHTHLD